MVQQPVSDQALTDQLLQAIQYFIQRQQLVVKAMRDLDIDLEDTGKWGSAIWTQQGRQNLTFNIPENPLDEARDLWEAVRRAWSRPSVSQSGKCPGSDEWTYLLHGKGCRLRNHRTGEVIDWDCPNPDAFDPYFFLAHLRWRLEVEPEDSLAYLREWIASQPGGVDSIITLISQMQADGLINRDWTLAQ